MPKPACIAATPKDNRRIGLADPGWPQQDHFGLVPDEAGGGEPSHHLAVHGGLEVGVKVTQGRISSLGPSGSTP